MFLPSQDYIGQASLGWWRTLGEPRAQGQANWHNDSNDTGHDLAKEWRNPNVVIGTILMLVGGDVVRAALAQSTGRWFTPVCFSFGWISYSFSALVDVFGDGKLLPRPDYPVKVFNLTSGHWRTNRNWIIGRIVRDHQTWISKEEPLNDNAIRIAVYEAAPNKHGSHSFRYTRLHFFGLLTILSQLVIASIPTILTSGREWGVLIVTSFGTLLALMMGALPQWTAEKLPNGHQSHQTFALTAGNGSRDVMVIKGMGHCLKLEELAAHESPQNGRPWIKFEKLSKKRTNSITRLSKEICGVPQGYFITICVAVLQAALWLLLFITIPGLEGHTWFLITVGGLGLFHNAVVAGVRRNPKERNLPLRFLDVIVTRKVMDGLMDLEVSYPGYGRHLVQEFLPGGFCLDEQDWWSTDAPQRPKTRYDQKRFAARKTRLHPRSMLQDHILSGEPPVPVQLSPAGDDTRETGPPVKTSQARVVLESSATRSSGIVTVSPSITRGLDSASNPKHVIADVSKLAVPRRGSATKMTEQVSPIASIDGIIRDATVSSEHPKRESASKKPEAWEALSKPPDWD